MRHQVAFMLAAPAALCLSFAAHAQPSVVNPQVTDSVSEVDAEMVGEAPAVGLGNFPAESAMSGDIDPAHNATSAQQNANTVLQATTTQGVHLLTGVGAEADEGETGDGVTDPDR